MNLGIRYKLIVLFYAIVVVVTTSFGIYSFSLSSSYLHREVSTSNLQIVKQIGANIDFLQKDAEDLSTLLLLNLDVQVFLRARESDVANLSQEEYNAFNSAGRYISALLASKDYISFIAIYGHDGLPYYLSADGSIGVSPYSDVQKHPLFQKARDLRGQPFWALVGETGGPVIIRNNQEKIALFRTLYNIETLTESGFLAIYINVSTIRDMYSSALEGRNGNILVLDEQNRLITQMDDTARPYAAIQADLIAGLAGGDGNTTLTLNGEETLVSSVVMDGSGWTVVYLLPARALDSQLSSIVSITVFIILACLVLGFLLTSFASSILTKPISKLLASMNRLRDGNFDERVRFDYQDEIGALGEGYNTMLDRIQMLVEQQYRLQLREREAELKALQAQINPHFLYNTLDSIFWKAQKSKDEEVVQMVYALSRLFRLTLNSGMDLTTVERERQLIESYMLLQKKRYKQKLDYGIDIAEDMNAYYIPKLIIQPFVENAILHGINSNNMDGHLYVRGWLEGSRMMFEIEDDGAGIAAAELAELKALIERQSGEGRRGARTDATGSGYAIQNVLDRLRIYYGADYLFDIESKEGVGTKVTIGVLPLSMPLPGKTEKGGEGTVNV